MKHGSFVVQKVKSKAKKYDWNFEAVFEDTALSTLKANIGGVCNEIETIKGSRRCGLATRLMEFCFEDPTIGSVNPRTVNSKNPANHILHKTHAEKVRNLAIENCDHIIYLVCAPSDNGKALPYASCTGYLKAALTTGHTMMFTLNWEKWQVLKTSIAIDMLKNERVTWITEYGYIWFFCKCKPNRLTQCEGLSIKDLI